MNEKERKLLMLEYARLAVKAKKSGVKLPTPEMEKISSELGLDGEKIIGFMRILIWVV
ncbi:hypothetical protein HYV91_00360 [Candidatus Wolfebacteria bacterium]|nr:hypothetical protein [Candidatus Wolfebacteria bacterium]